MYIGADYKITRSNSSTFAEKSDLKSNSVVTLPNYVRNRIYTYIDADYKIIASKN